MRGYMPEMGRAFQAKVFHSLVHGLSAVEESTQLKHNRRVTGAAPAKGQVFMKRGIVLAWLLATMCAAASAKDIALVANKNGGVSAITMADLVKACKGQMGRWPDGKPVTVVIREPGSPDTKMLEEKIYAATADEVRELIAAANHGRANRPAIIVVSSDEEVIHRVESAPGTVGLVDVYSITGAVTVVKIGGRLPLEAGYPLHGN